MICVSIDPALGGGHATVVTELGHKLTILDARADYGLSRTEEQLQIISDIATIYRPNIVIIETDAQQKGLANDDRLATLSALHNFQIRPHLTRMQKMDIAFGVAAMDQSFREGLIRIPYGDDDTRRRMEPLIKQLREWRPDRPAKVLRQDIVMALWVAWRYWKQLTFSYDQAEELQSRPSWAGRDPRLVGAR